MMLEMAAAFLHGRLVIGRGIRYAAATDRDLLRLRCQRGFHSARTAGFARGQNHERDECQTSPNLLHVASLLRRRSALL